MGAPLRWEHEGADWPHREASRFVHVQGRRWHVQRAGAGPAWLLLHGTGAATHSWRGLLPLLAREATVVAIDLPGHGFSDPLPAADCSLPGMARALGELLQRLQAEAPLPPWRAVLGHSAGAALAARALLDGHLDAPRLVSLNGAMLPFRGLAGQVFAPMARLLAAAPLVPRLVAWQARDPRAVARLVAATGSTLDAQGLDYYGRLMRSPGHVSAVLDMMANWDLEGLWRDLPRLPRPLWLLAGSADATVPPSQAQQIAQRVPGARSVLLPALGHLAHEEAPQRVLAALHEVLAAAP